MLPALLWGTASMWRRWWVIAVMMLAKHNILILIDIAMLVARVWVIVNVLPSYSHIAHDHSAAKLWNTNCFCSFTRVRFLWRFWWLLCDNVPCLFQGTVIDVQQHMHCKHVKCTGGKVAVHHFMPADLNAHSQGQLMNRCCGLCRPSEWRRPCS